MNSSAEAGAGSPGPIPRPAVCPGKEPIYRHRALGAEHRGRDASALSRPRPPAGPVATEMEE